MFVNRVLRRTFGSKMYEVTMELRRLITEEVKDLYSSPNIRLIKSRRMRWPGLVACMGRRDVHTGFWWGHLRGRDLWKTQA